MECGVLLASSFQIHIEAERLLNRLKPIARLEAFLEGAALLFHLFGAIKNLNYSAIF